MELHKRPGFIHHEESSILDSLREIVFGAEDGMVSTLGALTGIAAGTSNHFTVLLAGLVIVSVESISMSIGSYLSTRSISAADQRKLDEELIELRESPDMEREELVTMYVVDGWPKELATQMAHAASKHEKLFLKEMAYRELHLIPDKQENPVRGALFMFFSYMIGGSIPLIPYLFFSIGSAMVISVIITFVGLFILGAVTTRFTKRSWWRAGGEMLGLASIAAIVGYAIGQFADKYLNF